MRALWNQIDGQTLLDFTGQGGGRKDLDCKQCQFESHCNDDSGGGRVWAMGKLLKVGKHDMGRYLGSDCLSLDLAGFH